MKRIIAAVLSLLILIFNMAGCSSEKETQKSEPAADTSSGVEET